MRIVITMLFVVILSINCIPVNKKLKKRLIPNIYADFVALTDVTKAIASNIGDGDGNSKCIGNCSREGMRAFFGSSGSIDRASNIAQKAAVDAKAASDAQSPAGQEAAKHVKIELAEKALQSAKAAEAALSTKQQIVEEVQQEVHEAEAVLQEESVAKETADSNMNAAVQAANNAREEVQLIAALVETAQEFARTSEQVANGAQQEFEAKTKLVEASKQRLVALRQQYLTATQDFQKTKVAAYKAICAAVLAKQNIDDKRNTDDKM